MATFDFHPDLFECRNTVLEILAEHGFAWLSDFSSIDLLHEVYGIEICGIHQESAAREIQQILGKIFPE